MRSVLPLLFVLFVAAVPLREAHAQDRPRQVRSGKTRASKGKPHKRANRTPKRKRQKRANPAPPAKQVAQEKQSAAKKNALRIITLTSVCGLIPRRELRTATVGVARERFDHWTEPFDGDFGARLRALTRRERRRLGAPPNAGVQVTRVTRLSAARAAGLRRHDVLLDVAGTTVRRASDLRSALRFANVGDVVSLQVIRAEKIITLTAVLPQVTQPPARRRKPSRLRFTETDPVPRVGAKLNRIKRRIRRLRIRAARLRSR